MKNSDEAETQSATPIHQISDAARIEANELLAEAQVLQNEAGFLYQQSERLSKLSEELGEKAKRKKVRIKQLLYGNLSVH